LVVYRSLQRFLLTVNRALRLGTIASGMWGFRWGWLFGLAAVLQAQFAYVTYPTGINPGGLAAADLNGDGRPDLVIANLGSNSLTILLNDGMGGFTAAAPLSLGALAPQAVLPRT
jgi:FG-GAP-like repeat